MNMIRKKRGISELLSYVLLASLAISLSILVYPWLRGLVQQSLTKTECPDGVSIIVENAVCELTGELNLTLRNKGLFNINGFILRINNETDLGGNPAGLPFIEVDRVQWNSSLGPGNITYGLWEYRNTYGQVVEFEIQPIRIEDKKQILCGAATLRQRISCV